MKKKGKFPMPEDDERKMLESVNERALEAMESRSGKPISNIYVILLLYILEIVLSLGILFILF